MAMINCKECGKEISISATACPSCGAPNKPKKKTSLFTWVIAGLSAVAMFSCIGGQKLGNEAAQRQESAKSTEQKAAEALKVSHDEAEFQFGVVATKMVKAALKNPASFELVDAGVVDGGALCLTYRGTNSFNAVTTEQVAIKRSLKKGDWNKDCGGHTVVKMNYIKQAL